MDIKAFFPYNCNVMLWLHAIAWIIGGLLYAIAADAGSLKAVARFLLGPFSLQLCLFNSLNIGFAAGIQILHFKDVLLQSVGIQAFCWSLLVLAHLPPVICSFLLLTGSAVL